MDYQALMFELEFEKRLQLSGVKKKSDFLSILPPEILIKIFSIEDLELPDPAISHTLYPFATMNRFRDVHIYTLAALYRFQNIMKENVWLRPRVISLVISYENNVDSDEESDDEEEEEEEDEEDWTDEEEDKREGLDKKREEITNYLCALDQGTLITMLKSLPNLGIYVAIGKKLAIPFFDKYHEASGPAANSKLSAVSFNLRRDEDIEEEDRNFITNVAKISSLEELVLNLNNDPIPYPREADSNLILPPQSWNLKRLCMEGVDLFGVELKNLVPAFIELEDLTIECEDADANLQGDLALLPPTLVTIRITIPAANPLSRNPFNLDDTLQQFPRLTVIHLGGQFFTPALFPNLSTLDHVTCLHFVAPSPLFGQEILSLVKKGPLKMKSLSHLQLDITFEQLRPGAKLRPRWNENFNKKDARKILEIASKKSLKVNGSVMCALKLCRSGCESCGDMV